MPSIPMSPSYREPGPGCKAPAPRAVNPKGHFEFLEMLKQACFPNPLHF